ncbi:hypothetical protein [Actinomadura formosensis]|uniref:hypothetical protein n=1 Tax=Actinomadura formosensis TaxID=60706 RepID=UPI000AAA4E78|nr:hypothetical protein [Actinomadura formosensis]
MNIKLVASLLYPTEVAPHPNWSAQEIDSYGAIALLSLHHFSEYNQFARRDLVPDLTEDAQTPAGDWALVQAFGRSLFVETQMLGVRQLVDLSQAHESTLVKAIAAIMAACAYSDMNDFKAALSVLQDFVNPAQQETVPPLGRTLLSLQLGCRNADLGDYATALDHYDAAHAQAMSIDVENQEVFSLAEGSKRSSIDVIRSIVDGLIESAYLNKSNMRFYLGDADIWKETVRRPIVSYWLEHRSAAYAALSRWQGQVFDDQIDAPTRLGKRRVFGGGVSQYRTLDSHALTAELAGDWVRAREARLLLGRDRFLQSPSAESPQWNRRDGLALLLRSGDTKNLTKAARLLQCEGPLAVLIDTAMSMLPNEQDKLGRGHFAIFRAAASLLPSEAVDHIIASLLGRGIDRTVRDAAGLYRFDDEAWSAISALTSYASDKTIIQEAIWDAATQTDDPLVLRRLADIAPKLDWSTVVGSYRDNWIQWAADHLVGDGAGLSASVAECLAKIGDFRLVDQIAEAIRAGEQSLLLAACLVDASRASSYSIPITTRNKIRTLLLENIQKKRDDSARGSFSVGGIDVTYLATVFAFMYPDTAIWEAITACLTDSLIPDSDKANSLNWITVNISKVPDETMANLRANAHRLTNESRLSDFLDWNKSAAALRFLCQAKEIDPGAVFSAIEEMRSAADNQSRIECARSLIYAANILPPVFPASVALELTRDSSVRVRAASARSLAELAFSVESQMREVIFRKIEEMLSSDGIDVPLASLRGIQDLATPQKEALVTELGVVFETLRGHPDVRIRQAIESLGGAAA